MDVTHICTVPKNSARPGAVFNEAGQWTCSRSKTMERSENCLVGWFNQATDLKIRTAWSEKCIHPAGTMFQLFLSAALVIWTSFTHCTGIFSVISQLLVLGVGCKSI